MLRSTLSFLPLAVLIDRKKTGGLSENSLPLSVVYAIFSYALVLADVFAEAAADFAGFSDALLDGFVDGDVFASALLDGAAAEAVGFAEAALEGSTDAAAVFSGADDFTAAVFTGADGSADAIAPELGPVDVVGDVVFLSSPPQAAIAAIATNTAITSAIFFIFQCLQKLLLNSDRCHL